MKRFEKNKVYYAEFAPESYIRVKYIGKSNFENCGFFESLGGLEISSSWKEDEVFTEEEFKNKKASCRILEFI